MNFAKFLLFLLLILSIENAIAQSIVFRHTFGGDNHDQGRSVKQSPDGGYIIAGSTSSFGYGNSDIYVIKLDSLGFKQWSNVYGGSGIDWGFSVAITADSNYAVCGYTNSFGSGGYDVVLMKIDVNGSLLWQKTYGGSDWDFAYSVQSTGDGGFIIAGETYSFGEGNNDMYLIKTDEAGNFLWSKTYGGADKDYAKSVKETFDGGFILAGGTQSFAVSEDVYLVRTDQNGDTIWTKTFGGDSVDFGNAVAQSPLDSGFITVGVSYSYNNGNSDYYLVRTDKNGFEIWSHPFNSFIKDDYEADVHALSDGRFAIFGSSKSIGSELAYDYQFMITDPGGWVTIGLGGIFGSFNYDELAASFDITKDKGFILCGSTKGYGDGYTDIFIVKLDSAGHSDSTSVSSFSDSVILGSTFFSHEDHPVIKIFPNPVSNHSELLFNQQAVLLFEELEIIDISGRIIKSFNGDLFHFELNAKELSSGIYFMKIKTREKILSIKFAVTDVQ